MLKKFHLAHVKVCWSVKGQKIARFENFIYTYVVCIPIYWGAVKYI